MYHTSVSIYFFGALRIAAVVDIAPEPEVVSTAVADLDFEVSHHVWSPPYWDVGYFGNRYKAYKRGYMPPGSQPPGSQPPWSQPPGSQPPRGAKLQPRELLECRLYLATAIGLMGGVVCLPERTWNTT